MSESSLNETNRTPTGAEQPSRTKRSPRATDWWLSAWDEYGYSYDTGRIVQITTGVLALHDGPAIAVSVAGETPITLTDDAVGRFQECLSWAVEERQVLSNQAIEELASDSTSDVDAVVLTREQWQSLVSALAPSAEQHPQAIGVLFASAPAGWLHEKKANCRG